MELLNLISRALTRQHHDVLSESPGGYRPRAYEELLIITQSCNHDVHKLVGAKRLISIDHAPVADTSGTIIAHLSNNIR